MAKDIYQLFNLNPGSVQQQGQVPMGDFLLRLIQENYTELKKKYRFLRYINIFNRIAPFTAPRYNIQIYVDFINDTSNRVTNDRNKIQIGKPEECPDQPELKKNRTSGAQAIYTEDSIPIGKVFHSEEIFGESFEYVLDSRWNRILSDNPYYAVCSDFTKKESPTFRQSPKLDGTLDDIKNEIDKIRNGIKKLEEKSKEFQKYYKLIESAAEPKTKFVELFRKWLSNLRFCYSSDGETYNGTTHFFFFNGPNYYGDGKAEGVLADLVIDGNVGLTISNEKEKDDARSFLHDFRLFITQASFNLLVEYMNEQLKETAVRASIAQVMARNMSHNFGSHVLSNLIGDEVYEKLKDDAVKKEFEEFQRYIPLADVFQEDKNRQLPFFFQYLKSRMDYLSEVTFGVSNLLTTKMMYNDVMKELDQVRILLNYISGVSNFQYRFKLKYIGVDGEVDLEKEKQKDIGVAFPSDVLGCQAFYNIIENIIRNTAKHAKNKNDETVTFTITIKDDFAEEAGCGDIEGVDELYCVEIDNGVTEDNIDELVNVIKHGQNTRLDESVLQGQSLRSHSLGLLEMDASAAFLRQIDLPEIESDDYTVERNDKYFHKDSKDKKRLNILKAFAIKDDENDTKGRLGYRFFLQKPKEFLLVGNWCVTDEKKKQLLNYGIQFLTDEEFCTAMKSEKAFAHQFLIYQEGVSGEVKKYLEDDNDCRTLLPLRKLSISIEDKQEIEGFWKRGEKDPVDGKQVLQSLKEWTWKRYFMERIKSELKTDKILIRPEKDPSKDNQVVFLDHGNITNYNDSKQNNTDNEDGVGEVWVENLTSRTRSKLPNFSVLAKGSRKKPISNYINNLRKVENEWIKFQVFEAYHNKVIVIDERVQKFAMENKEGSGNDEMIRSIDLHESTNVHIPRLPRPKEEESEEVEEESEDVFSLDPTDFSELNNKVVAYVDKRLNDDNNQPIILVHYGVLERMCGGNVDDINEILNNWAGKGKAKRVVVTSGRGSHSLDLPNSVCFVNLSSVLYAFNENRNKYIINNLLNQSRRKRNE